MTVQRPFAGQRLSYSIPDQFRITIVRMAADALSSPVWQNGWWQREKQANPPTAGQCDDP